MMNRSISTPVAIALAVLLQACATPGSESPPNARALANPQSSQYNQFISDIEQRARDAQTKGTQPAAPVVERARADPSEYYKVFGGTGETLRSSSESSTAPGPTTATLAFEATDIRDVVKTVLFDILGENYYIDPQVGGNVTFRTVKPVPRNSLIPILEMLLRGTNAALVRDAGVYKVLPATQAVRGTTTPQLISGTANIPPGHSVVVMPLKYIGIKEMLRILEPFAKDAASIRGDELRNLVILTGTEREIRHLLETIEMFDIDWMAGMSVGFFQLQSVDVKNLVKEFEAVFGNKELGPLAGLYRVVPIERLNALLVISPQRAAIDKAREWIERLDSAGTPDGLKLFVYHLQNARADKLAPILQQALTGRQQPQSTAPVVAPGQTPVQVGTGPSLGLSAAQAAQTAAQQAQVNAQQAQANAAQAAAARNNAAATSIAASSGADLAVSRNVQIIADKDNNAIVILATQSEYALIESAIKKLDLAPRQVLIEAKIARVTLTGTFKLGLNWAFQNGLRIGTGNTISVNPAAANTPATATTPGNPFGISDASKFAAGSGFNYAWSNFTNGGNTINAIFNMLATDSRTRVISTPSLIATDNQKSQIQVGQSIATSTGSTVTPGTTTSGVVTTNQYVDTGVQLAVTPRVNAGGQITLDMSIELSSPADPANIPGAVPNTPAFNKTTATSVITVHSGQTILLGGLIEETSGKASSGLPFISQIPVLGALFGEQSKEDNRQELVMLITPTLIPSNQDLTDVTNELRKKMQYLQEEFPVARPKDSSANIKLDETARKELPK
ncbi:MAG: type II secretion system secretin GspD [Betaproteobacteria bacterium]